MEDNKGCIELKEEVKFYESGSPKLFVNDQEVGPISRKKGETFEETQNRMIKEYVLSTPGMKKYIKLIEKREEHHKNK